MSEIYCHHTATIDEGSQLGAGTKVWHYSHIMPEAVLGIDCNIGQNVYIASRVVLGDRVKVQNNVSLYEGVVCADEVFIGPSAVFTNVINPRSAVNRRNEYKKTHLGKGATIGANATILCGITLGAYAFVGAGTVVTKDVPDYGLVIGNPGRQVGWMSRQGHRLEFNHEGRALCQVTGESYILLEAGMVELVK